MMKSYYLFLAAVAVVLQLAVGFTTPSSLGVASSASAATQSSTRLNFFGTPKDDGSPGDYLCLVRAFGLINFHGKGVERTSRPLCLCVLIA